MRLKYSKTFMDAQEGESPIADVCWSPNNVKLAVATCERVVLLFDREGTRRDKFSTKPADAAAGKKSYVITSISFSENSELLGVAQSDNMVFVYRVGSDWSGKKVICNKFPLSGAPVKLVIGEAGFFTGTTDGKIRSLDCKSNKSSSVWTATACCVALARSDRSDRALASAHADGTIYLNGRMLLRHAPPPSAIVLLTPQLIVCSCEGRVSIYDTARGSLTRSVEASLPPNTRDLISAAASPGGQTLAFGIFDGCVIGDMKESGGLELTTLNIPHLYAARSLSWSGDGTKLAVGTQTGAVVMFEAVLRRWIWRDTVEVQHVSPKQLVLSRLANDCPPLTVTTKYETYLIRWIWRDTVEVQHVSPKQLVLSRLANDCPPLTVTTKYAPDIFNVRFIGNDWYAVCRTNSTLILCDIARGLTSEIPWSGSGERVYAAVGGACLLHRAGELSLLEYGLDKVLHTVRTERVNPHVLSVRINERANDGKEKDRKHLAYLLDRQTIAVVDLTTGVQIGQWWHEARIDWLELNEGGELVLLRDTRRRLVLLNLHTGNKEIIASGVGFVQWIENSDAMVAQTPTHLLIWYSAWDTSNVEMQEYGETTRGQSDEPLAHLQLDQHRLAFNNALRNGDLSGCGRYLDNVGSNEQVAPLWRQLAGRAFDINDIQLAAKCYRAVGDEARTFYLDQIVELAKEEGAGDVTVGLENPQVQARLAIFSGDLSSAEDFYVKKANRPDLAIDMYKQYNKWTEAIALADKTDRTLAAELKQQYMDYLISTGRYGAAGSVVASTGDISGAVKIWLKGGRARRAAAAALQHPHLLSDQLLVDTIHNQLVKEEWWEMAGEISERRGDNKTAVDYFAKGNNYARAVQLAREACPEEVTELERRWGTWLVSARQAGAAVPHLIEAGDTRAALAAALKAHHYNKALQIILTCSKHYGNIKACPEEVTELERRWGTWLVSARQAGAAVPHLIEAGDTRAALAAALKAHHYNKALQIILTCSKHYGNIKACPEEVTELERRWGTWLVSARQAGAAVPHLIEAGDTRAALAAALKAHHYNKALQIIQAIDDKESIREQCEQLGDHYISTQEWSTAEKVFVSCNMAARCVRAFNSAGKLTDGLRLAAATLSEEETRDIYLPLASQLREEGQLRKAEQIYIGLGDPDEAISMYKEAGQYEGMVRVVGAHRSSLLEATRRHVANELMQAGELHAAERYYLQAGDWKSAIQMYRTSNQWEAAERVARAHAPSNVQQQVALQWAAVLGGASGARLLAARGLAALGARWAIQAQRWDIAMELSSLGSGISKREVSRHEAAALAESQPEEAEAVFIRAGAAEHAVTMWLNKGQYERALAAAEQHATHMVEQVLVEGARAAAERGDLPQFEALMIRANRPKEVVQHYKDLELWDEASRVSREYLPESGEPVPEAVPELLSRAAAAASRGEWWGAVRLLAGASAAAANSAPRLAERAALRAARLARDHLHDESRTAAADLLAERFAAIGQYDIGEQLRTALTEGYTGGDEEGPVPQSEYTAEDTSPPQTEETDETEADAESEALERLARAGQWQRCLVRAGDKAPHYALRYVAHLFKTHPRTEGLDIESEELPEALTQSLETLRQYISSEAEFTAISSSDVPLAKAVCNELLVRVSLVPKALDALKDAGAIMAAAGADDRAMQAIMLLLGLHVPQTAPRAARSLPRYTDIIVADVAYYVCGQVVRNEGSSGTREAFVLLNRCLDLVEAAEEDSAHLLDYTDFECTDWSRTPLLLGSGCVRGAALEDVREWVLAVSMDQAVEQTLPVDNRGMYSSNVGENESCCVITGYPLAERLVTFTNGRCANREQWSRVWSASRSGVPSSASIIHLATLWCGPADYAHV